MVLNILKHSINEFQYNLNFSCITAKLLLFKFTYKIILLITFSNTLLNICSFFFYSKNTINVKLFSNKHAAANVYVIYRYM